MQQFQQPAWHWPPNFTAMGTASSNLNPHNSTRTTASQTMATTPGTAHQHLEPNDQGILRYDDGQIWPILVISNETSEGIVQVLLFSKNDM
jgi:hypothetical protein